MKDVSLAIDKGQVIALLGPSGCGKSTLLSSIGLINAPTSGSISINGVPVVDGPTSLVDVRSFRRQFIGYVFQKANLIPFLTALENVQLALEINDVSSRQARHRAEELLEYLEVGDRMRNLPNMLSGGQQQRVAVARALANNPSVLLADEPTASLDLDNCDIVIDAFKKANKEFGATVVIASHDPALEDHVATKFYLSRGELLEER